MTQCPRPSFNGFGSKTVLLLVVLLFATTQKPLGAEPPDGRRVPRAFPTALIGALHEQDVAERTRNEIWLIDSRRVFRGAYMPRLQYYRYESGLWAPSTESEFVTAQDATKPTCFWVHGNRIADGEAVDRGLGVYGHLNANATRPFRFVIWSWPSTRVTGPLRDVQLKAQVSDVYAYPLARLIDRLASHVELSFLGYSYGSRLICNALHLQTRQHLAARGIPLQNVTNRPPVRVVLMAAALDDTSLQAGGRNGRTLCHVGQMLITINCNDPAMKWYLWLNGVPGPQALGYSGAVGIVSPAVLQMDLSELMGSSHGLGGYLRVTDPAVWLGLRPHR